MIASSKIVVVGVMLGALSDPVMLAILTLAGTIVTATVTVVLAFKGTNRKIDELKVNTDGKLAELMRNTSRADIAEGKAAGKAEEKLEAALIAGAKDTPEVNSGTATTTKEPALSLVAKDVTVTKKSL